MSMNGQAVCLWLSFRLCGEERKDVFDKSRQGFAPVPNKKKLRWFRLHSIAEILTSFNNGCSSAKENNKGN